MPVATGVGGGVYLRRVGEQPGVCAETSPGTSDGSVCRRPDRCWSFRWLCGSVCKLTTRFRRQAIAFEPDREYAVPSFDVDVSMADVSIALSKRPRWGFLSCAATYPRLSCTQRGLRGRIPCLSRART